MSDIIRLLPDSVANQIAAGEVIQRPASIIKELVENSLDAGATHIQVVVEDAGKTLVQVVDDGCGMSDTDARLSFERHATSKIQQAQDLFSLHTMGFRGEALASIAAVAQVELRTRAAGSDLGTTIRIEGSKVVEQKATACPVGANFAVKNLFFNIPARRKFLKSNQTELTNITAEFERIALAHPTVSFTLHSGTSLMLDLPGGNFRQRIVGIFGRRLDAKLIPIKVSTTLARIDGFVGVPTAARRKNAQQYLFVNGRFMRHPYFSKAILMAYERLIPDGQQVPFFVNFEVDPARIDVNIHPTKTEIKFEDDNAIFQILMATVREALGKYGGVPSIDFDTEARPDIPTFGDLPTETASHIVPPQIHVNDQFNPFQNSGGERLEKRGNDAETYFPSHYSSNRTSSVDWQQVYDKTLNADHADTENEEEGEYLPSHYDRNAPAGSEDKEHLSPRLYDNLPEEEQASWKETLGNDFLQVNGRYIITSFESGMAVVDQHRAHIRILYEGYMRRMSEHQAVSQQLLFPEILTISPSEDVVFNGLLSHLMEIGFDVSPLGSGSYSILAVPVGTEGVSPISLVSSILADAVEGQTDISQKVNHIIALSLASKVAMPVGQALSSAEMRQLLEQLFACSAPAITPDGHRVWTVVDPEKLF